MFNISGQDNAKSYQITLNGMMNQQGRKFITPWQSLLKKTWDDAAAQIDNGDTNLYYITQDETRRALELLKRQYKQYTAYFGTFTFLQFNQSQKSISPPFTKDMETVYWQHMQIWSAIHTAEKVVPIVGTSNNLLKRIITQGAIEGLSNREIANKIKEKNKAIASYRANMIVRTETHSVANASIDQAVRSTKYKHTRNWVSAIDDRVRGARLKDQFNHLKTNGQKRNMDEPFDVIGKIRSEKLMYPGDPEGSAANIINCRCVLTYTTER